MALKDQIEADIKQAMLSKDKDALRALRAIKSLILLEATKEGSSGTLSADEELKLLTKAAKQRRESAEIYKNQNREDLAQNELTELAIVERYLPKQLSEQEVRTKLQDIISQIGANGPGDMGKVMGAASKELAGQADNKVISGLVKELLTK